MINDHIFPFSQNEVDSEAIIDEIDMMVSKYLAMVEKIKSSHWEQISENIQSSTVYWNRLQVLFDEVVCLDLEDEQVVQQVCQNALQKELQALEEAYLVFDQILAQMDQMWSKELFSGAKKVIDRMEQILDLLNFAEFSEDRVFLAEIQLKNSEKYQKWIFLKNIDRILIKYILK